MHIVAGSSLGVLKAGIYPLKGGTAESANGDEQAAFVPECLHPPELGEPALQPPVVLRWSKQLGLFSLIAAEKSAGIGPHVLDAVLGKPALHLGERMSMFLRMLVLIAPPRLAPSRIVLPLMRWVSTMRSRASRFVSVVSAQTGAMLGIQSANLAVSAYANDQSYLRLRSELPHFRRPLAVVSLFTPTLFDRNMDDDRPHLDTGLVWQPPVERWRLQEILRLVVRYRKAETIDRGVSVTRDVLRATCDLAQTRGAVPVIVLPQFSPEEPGARELRNRVLDGANLPVVRVELDGSWRIPGDGHPDARAAHAIATAIANRLQPALAARG